MIDRLVNQTERGGMLKAPLPWGHRWSGEMASRRRSFIPCSSLQPSFRINILTWVKTTNVSVVIFLRPTNRRRLPVCLPNDYISKVSIQTTIFKKKSLNFWKFVQHTFANLLTTLDKIIDENKFSWYAKKVRRKD